MILISSCLIGEPVRYDGRHQLKENLKALLNQGVAIHACPEILGGLPIPRPPAEIVGGDGHDVLKGHAKVMTKNNEDVTAFYIEGAKRTLSIILKNDIHTVILKANSPSCGSDEIYNGHFDGVKVNGDGVTSALLKQNGIKVYDEHHVPDTLWSDCDMI